MGSAPHFEFESAPDLPGSDRLSRYGMGAIRRLAHALWDVEVEGAENVPHDGPALIAPNHLSFCDSIFVPAALPRRVWAIGKAEYLDDWKTKHLFPALGMIPVNRGGGHSAMRALDTAAGVLDGGHLFLIYPEGTRSRSHFLHKGRTGAARLAIRCDAPVVPVGHEGTLAVQPPDQFTMSVRKPVTIRFGAPMWAHEHGDPEDPRTLRRFTDAVMYEISQLSGQRYVHVYAGRDDQPGVDPTKKAVPAEATSADAPDPSAPVEPSAPSAPSRPSRPSLPSRVPRPSRSADAATTATSDDGDEARVTPRAPSVVGGIASSVPTPPARAVMRPASDRPSVPTGQSDPASADDAADAPATATVPVS